MSAKLTSGGVPPRSAGSTGGGAVSLEISSRLTSAAEIDSIRRSVKDANDLYAHFLIDVARAYGQRRRASEAVRTLEEVEALTPEQIPSHPAVRQLVRDLLRGERGRANPLLRALARRVGALC